MAEVEPKLSSKKSTTDKTKKTIQDILKLEGGPPLCLIYPKNFYKTALWVPEKLSWKDAMSFFDYKNNKEESLPTRIFPYPKHQSTPRPEARFTPYRVWYSATHLDWYRHMENADQQIIRSAVYGTKECPRLCNEWDHFTAQAMNQGAVNTDGKWDNTNPRVALKFYRFVRPVVQVIDDLASPCSEAVLQLRYDPVKSYYFYNCYAKGVSEDNLETLLADAEVFRI